MMRNISVIARRVMVVALAGMVFVGCSGRQSGHVNAPKIVEASRAYTADLKSKGLSVPATVSLQELIDRRLLSASDVSGLGTKDVTINLSTGTNGLQDVLVRARLADGQEIVLLGDGSVQQVSRNGVK